MAPRKKTAVKKKAAKKTTSRATRTKPKRTKHRETPLEKLAFRVSILEEGFDELERDLRNLRHANDDHVVVRIAGGRVHAKPEAIDVTAEAEVVHALDELNESPASHNE